MEINSNLERLLTSLERISAEHYHPTSVNAPIIRAHIAPFLQTLTDRCQALESRDWTHHLANPNKDDGLLLRIQAVLYLIDVLNGQPKPRRTFGCPSLVDLMNAAPCGKKFSRKKFPTLPASFVRTPFGVLQTLHRKAHPVAKHLPQALGFKRNGSQNIVKGLTLYTEEGPKEWVKISAKPKSDPLGQLRLRAASKRLQGKGLKGLPVTYTLEDGTVLSLMPKAQHDLWDHQWEEEIPIPLKQRIEWSIQLVREWIVLKEANCAHRDIKEENVLVLSDGTVTFCDYGAAIFGTWSDIDGGTAKCIAPECYRQMWRKDYPELEETLASWKHHEADLVFAAFALMKDASKHDEAQLYLKQHAQTFTGTLTEWHRADTYSFGILLFNLLLGVRDSEYFEEVATLAAEKKGIFPKIWKRLKRHVEDPAILSSYDDLTKIIEGCMRPNPAKRTEPHVLLEQLSALKLPE